MTSARRRLQSARGVFASAVHQDGRRVDPGAELFITDPGIAETAAVEAGVARIDFDDGIAAPEDGMGVVIAAGKQCFERGARAEFRIDR